VKPPATLHAAPFASLVRQFLSGYVTSLVVYLYTSLHLHVSHRARDQLDKQFSSVTNGNIALPLSQGGLKQCSMICSLHAHTRAATTTPR
jgi:hypothetical protein